MDFIQYYAKHGPKKSKGEGSQKQSTKNGAKQPDVGIPVYSARPEPQFDDSADSDVEEDDTKQISDEELLVFIQQMRRSHSREIKPQVTLFNKTQNVECDGCVGLNIRCQATTGAKCQQCSVKRKMCSRADVFYKWMLRHRFNVSWKKAEELHTHGQSLVRTGKGIVPRSKGKVPKLEESPPKMPARSEPESVFTLEFPTPSAVEENQVKPSVTQAVEVRTSPRTPVPRVRKELNGITTSIEPPSLGRGRKRAPGKTSSPVAPKRRKVLELEAVGSEQQSEPDLEKRGREIMPAPQSVAVSSEKKKAPATPKPRISITMPKRSGGRKPAGPRRPDPRTLISARLAETEKRLDAMEARLQQAELGLAARQQVAAELDSAIGQLEGNGDVQKATSCLRALHASLLQHAADGVPNGPEGSSCIDADVELPDAHVFANQDMVQVDGVALEKDGQLSANESTLPVVATSFRSPNSPSNGL
ncbi:hypothetical protein R3P38DRAFT_2867052 [Favolaschia claudopus]|uniref:Uncharacterized protein n=1 Tax=Favolaschia claudopus TaxID=2862362 RepID=A0AAW0DA30_9AGAR